VQRGFGGILLGHDVEDHAPQDCEVVWAIAQSASVLVLAHDNIEPLVRLVFDTLT
jgi:hypothetical protein